MSNLKKNLTVTITSHWAVAASVDVRLYILCEKKVGSGVSLVTFILGSETTIKPRNISCQFRGFQDSSLYTKNAHCLQLQWGFIIQLQSCIKGCVAYVPPS